MTKKFIYISAFMLFGFLVQFLAHELIEIWYIDLLVNNFSKYGFGLSWSQWFLIHHILTVIFMIAGLALGFFSGKFWWKKIYEDKQTGGCRWWWKNRLLNK